MRVLAIETSCDETGIAILEGTEIGDSISFEVLGSALLSQAALHAPYGGVYPTLAKREHEKNLPTMLEQTLSSATKKLFEEKSANIEKLPEKSPRDPVHPPGASGGPDYFSYNFSTLALDAIAVTEGPGLEPALWTGITFAQKLAKETGLPLIGINHMEGHIISSLVQNNELHDIKFPVLALLISGGHTEFVVMKEWFQYEIIGKTLDDAVGEAYDKVARMLDLPYPGGPEISKLADEARKKRLPGAKQKSLSQKSPRDPVHPPGASGGPDYFLANFSVSLPRPMIQAKDCNMSFSGLKTAVLYALKGKNLNTDEKALFAQEFEDAVGDVLVAKTRRALIETGAKTFVIGGGVAANRYLRERLGLLISTEFPDVEFRLPELSITGDNAIMIAEAALLRMLKNGISTTQADLRAQGNFSLNSSK